MSYNFKAIVCGVALVISKSELDSKDGLMAQGQCQINLGRKFGSAWDGFFNPTPARLFTVPAKICYILFCSHPKLARFVLFPPAKAGSDLVAESNSFAVVVYGSHGIKV